MATVLIADDEETTRMMLGSAVKAAGHEVCYALNGNMAVNAYRAKPFDVVVMDIAMPDLNGLLATRQLLAEFPQARIIVISGVNAEQLDYGLEYGAAAAVMKPVEPKALQELLEDVINDKGAWGSSSVR